MFVYNGWIDDSLLVEVKTSAQAELESRDLDAASRSSAVRQIELFTRPAFFSVFVWVRLVVFGMLFEERYPFRLRGLFLVAGEREAQQE